MKRKENRLFALLVKNYLLFTLVLLFLAGGVYWLWDRQFERLLNPVDWDALLEDYALTEGRYEELDRYLHGAGNGFAVLDETGAELYRAGDMPDPLTPGELACVPFYGDTEYLDAFPEAEGGDVHYRVLRTRLREDGSSEITGDMALDGDFRVLSGRWTRARRSTPPGNTPSCPATTRPTAPCTGTSLPPPEGCAPCCSA